jgi:hypothetical protein
MDMPRIGMSNWMGSKWRLAMFSGIIPVFQSLFAVYIAVNSLTGCARTSSHDVGNRIVLTQSKGFDPQEKTVLFEDDFSSGKLENWDYKGDWKIVDGAARIKVKAGRPYLSHPIDSGHYELRLTYTRNNPWKKKDFLMINFRYIDPDNRVWVAFGQESLHLQEKVQGEFISLDSQAISNFKNTPYRVRIVAEGSHITVYRGETNKRELVVLHASSSSLLTADSFQITVGSGADFSIDDVQVLK